MENKEYIWIKEKNKTIKERKMKIMANGIYTALDYDMNYLAHSGVKGMKWYRHLYGAQQSLSKYAKGLATQGVVTPTEKKAFRANLSVGKASGSDALYNLKKGNIKGALSSAKTALIGRPQDRGKGGYLGAARLVARNTMQRAASKVVGAAASGVGRLYRAAVNVDQFIHSSTFRKAKVIGVKKKAKKFATMIGTAIRSIPGKVASIPGKLRSAYTKHLTNRAKTKA